MIDCLSIACGNSGIGTLKIKELIQKKSLDGVYTVNVNDNVLDMAETLCRHQIASVLVFNDDDQVAGIATERDLTRQTPQR